MWLSYKMGGAVRCGSVYYALLQRGGGGGSISQRGRNSIFFFLRNHEALVVENEFDIFWDDFSLKGPVKFVHTFQAREILN